MARINAFLSRLFSSRLTEEDPSVEEGLDQASSPVQTQYVPDPTEVDLELSGDHPVHSLYDLRLTQGDWIPAPKLQLAVSSVLSLDAADRELARLQTQFTAAASARLKAALPKEEEPPDLDALPWIFLSADKLTAWMLVFPPVGGGKEVEREDLSRALEERGVSFGVDEELLDRLPEESGRYFQLFAAAQGATACPGQDGSVVDRFPRSARREMSVDENDQVDYTSLNTIYNVEQGEEICHAIEPTPGIPGRTVLDDPISAKDGRPAALPKGRNTELSEDGLQLLASVNGHVEFSNRAFQVRPVMEIAGNVDFSTGNLNFLGDLHIRGDVCGGFTVRATGNIHIDGVVEASTVDAGGDLLVAKGIQGGGEAVIRAQRSIIAKYIENSRVYARENLQTDCLINCEVYSDGEVQVRSGRGTIVGGKTCAARLVSASIVGAPSERPTLICLGGQPCEDYEREQLTNEIEALHEELTKVACQPDSPQRSSRLTTVRMKLSISRKKLERLNEETAESMDESGEAPVPARRGRLSCGTAYPGTEIQIGNVTTRLDQEIRQCNATLQEGEIRMY